MPDGQSRELLFPGMVPRLTLMLRLMILPRLALWQPLLVALLPRLAPWLSLIVLSAAGEFAVASPPDLQGLTYTQRLGNSLPLQSTLSDERGSTLRLSEVFQGKPLVLVLGYFHCPNLCGIVRADLFHALERSDLVGGRDYNLVSLSIDPTESSRDAASAKTEDLKRFPAPGASAAWHFLVGSKPAVDAIANAVGFQDRFDPKLNQFMHPSGIVFITPGGVVSSYLLGVGYQPNDVRLALTRAAQGTVQAAALPILLLCYDFDESTGRYSLAIMKLLRLAGVLTVLTLGVTLFLAFRRDRSAA
jgi:protein SCO1